MASRHDDDPASELTELLSSEGESLRRLARSLTSDASAAEDIVQESAVAALRRGGTQDIERPAAWLAGTVKRLAARRWRERERRTRREQAHARAESTPSTSELLGEREVLADVMQAVRELDDIYARPLLLLYFHDMSAEEAAVALGIPAATVRTRHRRALQQLRQRLDKTYGQRDAWCVALFAFCGPRERVAPPRVAPRWGALSLGAVACFVVGAAWWFSAREQPPTRALEPREAPLAAAARIEPPPLEDGARRIELREPAPDPAALRRAARVAAARRETAAIDERKVRGVVRDAFGNPVPFAQVRRGEMLDLQSGRARARCDENGAYEFALTDQEDVYVHAWKPGWLASDVVRMPVPQALAKGIDFVLPGIAHTLEGRVVDAHGTPSANVWVRVGPELGDAHDPSDPYGSRAASGPLARTDEQGHYRLDGLPTGGAVLIAHLPGQAYARRALTIEPGIVNTFDVRLDALAKLRGRVLDLEKNPLEGATLEVENCGPGTMQTATSAADGAYELCVPALPRQRVVVHAGAVLETFELFVEPGEVREWSPVLARVAAASEPSGEPIGSLSVSLFDEAGRQVEPHVVCLSASTDRRAGPCVNAVRTLNGGSSDGRWCASEVVPGHYGVWASSAGWGLFLVGEIDVTAHGPDRFDLRVPSRGVLQASVAVPTARLAEAWTYTLDPHVLGHDLRRGTTRGPLPARVELAQGPHTLRVESASGDRRELEFEIRAGETTVLELDLP